MYYHYNHCNRDVCQSIPLILCIGMGAATAAGVAAAHNHGLLLKNKQDALAVPDPIDSGLKPWTVTGVLPDRERKQINFEGKVYVAPLTTVGKSLF
jgi:hypothetical protein